MRGVLLDRAAPYATRSYDAFLQGSYANDTNVYADSDVDIVMRLSSAYYSDTSNLTQDDKAAYDTAFSRGDYGWADFRGAVATHLKNRFGAAVDPSGKAIFVAGDGRRRDVDVLVAAEYRKYTRFRSALDVAFVDGICFWTPAGVQIVNYPKQHSENCTRKHQVTRQWFKPTVRILKNMRNRMTAQGAIPDGLAPSYFLEGLLYNVPAEKFGATYADTVAAALNWLLTTDRSGFVCANEQYYLCHPTSAVTWRAEDCQRFLNAARDSWNGWSG